MAATLGLLVEYRRPNDVRRAALVVVALGTLSVSSFAYTANLGGQIRHTEVRPSPPASSTGGPAVFHGDRD